LRTVHNLLQADSSFVEHTEAERAALASLVGAFDALITATNRGVDSFKD